MLRRFLSKKIPSCWSFYPASALRQQLHSSLCACCRALKPNNPSAALSLLCLGTGLGLPAQAVHCSIAVHPAQSGILFSGNRLRRFLSKKIPSCWSFCSASALRQQAHSDLCNCCRALQPNNPGAALSLLCLGTGLGLAAQAIHCSAWLTRRNLVSYFPAIALRE